jgi:hypothetical protein
MSDKNQILRKWILEKLINTSHLNVEEREMIGIQTIKMSEIKEILGQHFQSETYFPVVKKSEKGLLHDGYVIEKIADTQFILNHGSYGPQGDYRGSSKVGEPGNFDVVVESYFEHSKDIDGIRIEKENKCADDFHIRPKN